MKKLFAVAAVAVSLLLGGTNISQAHSHSAPYLSGSTMMKVHNNSDYTIVDIRSSNSEYGTTYRWGGSMVSGMIRPHSTAIVNFGDNTNSCVFFVEMTTSNGRVHIYGNVNVCHQNNITVNDW